MSLTIEALNAGHDRAGFSSGSEPLDRYLREQASQDVKRRISNCFVASFEGGSIAGFYTLAAAGVALDLLTEVEMRRLPRYGLIPACRIGRLAVSQNWQGKGLGSALIMDAAKRAAGADTAVYAVIVDAKDERAASFYRHLGFRECGSRLSLYLPISVANKVFGIAP